MCQLVAVALCFSPNKGKKVDLGFPPRRRRRHIESERKRRGQEEGNDLRFQWGRGGRGSRLI